MVSSWVIIKKKKSKKLQYSLNPLLVNSECQKAYIIHATRNKMVKYKEKSQKKHEDYN